IVLQAARGAARRAGKHEAAELVVEDEDVVGDFDPRRRTQPPGGFTVAVFERHWVLLQLKRAALLYAHTSHRVAGHLLSESRTFVSGSQRLRRTQRLSAGPLAWPVSCATSAHAWVMGSRWMPFSFAARSATRRVISAALCCLLASSGSGGAVQ